MVFQKKPQKDLNYFARLKLDQELATISWPHGADLAPEYQYYLAFKNDPELQSQFQKWGYVKIEKDVQIEEAAQ